MKNMGRQAGFWLSIAASLWIASCGGGGSSTTQPPPSKTTPTVTVTPGSNSITTTQAVTVTVAVSGGSGNPFPTGTVTLSSGAYTSASTTLISGSAPITIPAGSLALGSDRTSDLPAGAQEVTGDVHRYAEILPARSPDGRWLAFEYYEIHDPNYPKVGIMDLSQIPHPWHPVLESEPGRHLYAGDFSWSPDSRWIALLTDYPEGSRSFWEDLDIQVVKVNVYTHEVVRLTSLPPNTPISPTTAWLRSGLIVFSGLDGDIYGVSENGGVPQKLVHAPKDKCAGGTNTLAVSRDEQKIAFTMDEGEDRQNATCNSLWIADIHTGDLRRVPTTGLQPLSPFWLEGDSILFSGVNVSRGKWLPLGIYSVSLSTGKVARLLKGPYMTPSVCDSCNTLYFSWGPRLRTKLLSGREVWPTINGFYGFHIWKIPLSDVMR